MGLVILGCGPSTPEPELGAGAPNPPVFTEVAASSGLDFLHLNGATGLFYYPELMQGGAAFLDFDNDSLLDVYLVQSGPLPIGGQAAAANRLYRNLGASPDGQTLFEEVRSWSGEAPTSDAL